MAQNMRFAYFLTTGLTVLTLISCSGSPASRFYLLKAAADPEPAAERSDIAIGLSIVEFPEYLDRSQIISYRSEHELHLAEYDRWAEPLESNFKRILVENLSALLNTDNITLLPNERTEQEAYFINIKVIRFEYEISGNVVLTARWNVIRNLKKEFELDRRSEFMLPATADDFNGITAAMSNLVYQLSRVIAGEIKHQSDQHQS